MKTNTTTEIAWWRDDGHLTDVALSAIADGSPHPPEILTHLDRCDLCTSGLGAAAAAFLDVQEIALAVDRRARAAARRRLDRPWWSFPAATALGFLLAASTGVSFRSSGDIHPGMPAAGAPSAPAATAATDELNSLPAIGFPGEPLRLRAGWSEIGLPVARTLWSSLATSSGDVPCGAAKRWR